MRQPAGRPARQPAERAGRPVPAVPAPAASTVDGASAAAVLQRSVGNAAFGELVAPTRPARDTVDAVLRSAGEPLPAPVRAEFEDRLGADFAAVRVHTGAAAHAAAASVRAEAFTAGTHVVFAPGRFQPGTPAGRRVLAHELAHVLQQRSGPVAGSDAGGGLRLSDPSDAFEQAAATTAARAVAAPVPAGAAVRDRTAARDRAVGSPGGGGGAVPVVQRLVKITFEEQADELADFDTANAKIIEVIATRDNTAVSVENAFPTALQRAHTTSNVVFTTMFVRKLNKKTWSQAWQLLRDSFQFLHNVLTAWYADPTLTLGTNATVRNSLPGLIQAQITACDAELTRGGFPIAAPLWAARPIGGVAANWQWYDHAPLPADGVTPATHEIRPWKPLLSSGQVHKLEQACQQWMLLRGQFPWTSVDTESYVTGDSAGPGKVKAAIKTYAGAANLAKAEARDISDAIISTFDFFPPSLTAARTLEDAAAAAARHVVEHFQYHPKIQPGWRDAIAAQFLLSWKDKIGTEKAAEDAKTKGASKAVGKSGKSGKPPKKAKIAASGRDTSGLKELLRNWTAVKTEYNRVYTLLKASLV